MTMKILKRFFGITKTELYSKFTFITTVRVNILTFTLFEKKKIEVKQVLCRYE